MTQHSTRAASPLPGASLGSRLPQRSWPVRLVLVAALLLAVLALFHAGSTAHAADKEISGLTLSSPNPGELVIAWDAASPTPDDYRVTWKKSDGKWPSYKNDNTVDGGNAFPTGTSHTVSDLEEGTEYSVRVRTRYHNSEGHVEESGPWSDPPVELTVSAQPPPKKGEGDSSEGRSTSLPAKPTGLLAAATHSSVLLLWTDPGDDGITGYQILRGDDADSLAVLTNDTGNASASYTDDTVSAETTYAYAIKARKAGGLGPQSDPITVRTLAAPPEPVEPISDMATAAGAPTISGTPMVGQTLTADTSGITDADGLTTPGWTYQWVRVSADLTENDISGATSQTYKLVSDDVGHKIKVVVSFTDDTSELESRPSEPFPEHKFVLASRTLVSNRGKKGDFHLASGLGNTRAQGFQTGSHIYGYDISKANVTFIIGSLPKNRFSLSIYSSNEHGNPGDELHEFIDPNTISTGDQSFTAPDNVHLEPNTKYFLRIWGDESEDLKPSIAASTAEDSASARGWSIADVRQQYTGSWETAFGILVIQIHGSETSGAGPAAESLTVTSTPTKPTNYQTGDTISFALAFDEVVTVSGDPELEFDIGGTKRRATYDSAESSGEMVVFSYTVDSTDYDSDGIHIGFVADAVKLDMDDSIQDSDSNDATYRSVRPGRQADHRVNSGPGIALIEVTSSPAGANRYVPGEDINITVTFEAPVTVTGDPEFEFSLGNSGETRNVRAQYNADLSTTTDVVFTYTVLPTDEDSNGIFLHDGTNSFKLDTDDSIQNADNRDAVFDFPGLSTQGSHKIDPRPRAASVEVTSTPTAGTDTYGAGEVIEFTVTFNQPVIVTGEPHYVFSLGNSGDTRDLTATYDAGRSSARALVFTYTVVSTDVDNNGIYLYDGNTSFVLETGETVRNKFGKDARTDYSGNVGQSDHKVDGSLTPTNTPPGGLPTISGTAEVGQTLTASTTGITDDDGLTTPGWTYQWIRVDTEGTETDIPGATSQTYTLVSGDEVLQFRVRVSFTDDGSASETLRSAIFPSSRAPSAPETLSLTTNRGDVTLDWTPPTDTGSSAITKYQYRVSNDGGSTWSPDFTDVPDQNSDSDQADERSYTISSLTLGTEHTIEVRAHNATRPGASGSRTVTPATTPGRPQHVNATAGNQQVALTWSAPSSDGGSPITHYQYRVRDETDNVWLPGFATGLLTVPDSDADMDLSDELSLTVTGLTNGHQYKFNIRAHNDQGGSGVADAAATPVGAPDAPASLTATPGNTQATLAWTPPASDGGAAITKYQYRVSADGGSTWSPDWTDVPDGSDTGTDQGDERTLTITSLANGPLHTFQVRAVNSEGNGDLREATATPAAGPSTPDAPASLTATPGDAQATLTWTAPTFDGNSAITKYQYRVSVDDGTTWNPDWADVPDGPDAGSDLADERALTLKGLEAVILHTFQVRAVNSEGDGGAAQTTATPTGFITLAADFTSIVRELHDVTLTLTRTGSTAEVAPITLYVENAAGSSVITSSPRNQNLTFGIGVDTLEFTVPQDWITRLEAGNFLASVEAGSEYDLSDASTSVEVLFPSTTLMEVRLDKNSYEVTEGDTLPFNVLFNVLQEIEAPNKVFNYITVQSSEGTADFDDAPRLSHFARVQPSSWNLVGNRYSAAYQVTHQTVEDALYERPMGEHESYEIGLSPTSLTPTWLTRIGPTMGTTRYPVTITDNETLNLSAELSSTGLTAGQNLRIDEDAGQTVTLTVTNSDLASNGNPVTLPPGVKLKITPVIPPNRAATETADWSITPDEIDLGGTATITIVDDMLEEGPESVTFEVGFDDDAMFQSARATLTINDDEYTGPVLQSAEINGPILNLEFSNTLDTNSRPPSSSFTVKVDGTAVSLASSNPVTISGSTVTLRLRSAVPAGDTVTVSYTEPETNPIQDTGSLVAPSFTDEPVSNDERVASIEAVKSPVVEGEEEVEFRVTLSRPAPEGGVNVQVELAPFETYTTVNPVSVADYKTHNVQIAQGQTEAVLEIRTTRDKIANDNTRLTATLLTGTDYVISDTPSADIVIRDPDQVNIRFADGCGQTRTVGEGDGEVSFDIVLDNPTAFDFTLVITYRNGSASRNNDFSEGPRFLQFEKLQTSFTVTVPIIDDIQLEHTEGFFIQILGTGLDPDLLTPTCGESNPRLSFEITDNDTANIVLDAPEEVTEGQPIKLGLGPRPNVLCPVPFTVTTTLTITGDTNALQDSRGTSLPLRVPTCGDPEHVKIYYDDGTEAATVWQTIDDPGPRGDRQVTFTIEPLMSDDSRVSKLILDRMSATVTIKNKPNRQPTGRPTLSGQHQVGHTLTASTSGIDDLDGLTSPGYTYQWERQVNGVYTDIAGADEMIYTLTSDDQGKRVRVVVTLTDDDRNIHTLESVPTGLVQAQTSVPAGKVKVSLGATAYVVEEGRTLRVTVTLAEAPEEDPVYIPFTVTPANGASRSDFAAWSSYTRQLRFDVGDTTDRINVHANDDTLNDDGETLTLCLGDLPEPYATLAGLDCATINIMDNDDPNSVEITFRRDTYWASEDGNPAWPRIWVYPVPDREITIPVTFTPGGSLSEDDYTITNTSVTFGPGLYGVHGDGHITDNRTYASLPIEVWAIDDNVDDDGEYLDLAFGEMPPFVSVGATGKFSYQPTETRVWFNDNEFTEVEVTDSTNRSLTRRMRVTFADAELEAKEGLYEIGTVATVRVQLSRPRNKESTVVIPITVTRHGTTTAADYAGAGIPSSITFLPGQTEYSFRVRAVNDDIDDDDEYLTLSFGTLPELVYAGDQATTRINLVDDDDPPVEVFFEQANYEVTNIQQDGTTEYARLNVKVKLSAAPERFIDVGIVAESIQGGGGIHFEYSAYIPRGPHDGAHFYADDTEFTLQIYISARGGFDLNQTYRLSFKGMSYKMFVGSPATATITINADA